jgi:hypothetical protein
MAVLAVVGYKQAVQVGYMGELVADNLWNSQRGVGKGVDSWVVVLLVVEVE